MASRLPQTALILAGGRGTRLHANEPLTPKPLVEVGDHPILWHVVRIYAAQGVGRFVVCLGHRGEVIERFVAGARWPPGVEVLCADTGSDTPTGGRIARASVHLKSEPFFATYADGVADIDLAVLADRHRESGALATMTVVRPRLPFGVVDLDGGDRISGFHEKPISEHWINGGFFCLEPGALDYIEEDSVLERDVFTRLAHAGRLGAYRHRGFWECLDTYKDAMLLDRLWREGRAPWKLWR